MLLTLLHVAAACLLPSPSYQFQTGDLSRHIRQYPLTHLDKANNFNVGESSDHGSSHYSASGEEGRMGYRKFESYHKGTSMAHDQDRSGKDKENRHKAHSNSYKLKGFKTKEKKDEIHKKNTFYDNANQRGFFNKYGNVKDSFNKHYGGTKEGHAEKGRIQNENGPHLIQSSYFHHSNGYKGSQGNNNAVAGHNPSSPQRINNLKQPSPSVLHRQPEYNKPTKVHSQPPAGRNHAILVHSMPISVHKTRNHKITAQANPFTRHNSAIPIHPGKPVAQVHNAAHAGGNNAIRNYIQAVPIHRSNIGQTIPRYSIIQLHSIHEPEIRGNDQIFTPH